MMMTMKKTANMNYHFDKWFFIRSATSEILELTQKNTLAVLTKKKNKCCRKNIRMLVVVFSLCLVRYALEKVLKLCLVHYSAESNISNNFTRTIDILYICFPLFRIYVSFFSRVFHWPAIETAISHCSQACNPKTDEHFRADFALIFFRTVLVSTLTASIIRTD